MSEAFLFCLRGFLNLPIVIWILGMLLVIGFLLTKKEMEIR